MTQILISALLLTIASVLILGTISPIMADSQGDDKSYKGHWAVPIGDSVGTLEITENTDKHTLKEQAVPLSQATLGCENIHKAKLGKAVNDDGKYFLVWKLISFSYDIESDTKTKTLYVLDAGTSEPLSDPITKEGGSCGDKTKSKTSGDHA